AGSAAGRLRRAPVAPRVPRPRAGDLERLRHPPPRLRPLPRRSAAGGGLCSTRIAGVAVSRWEKILDQKPQDLRGYVLEKVAGQLVQDIRDFPPPIEEWLDEALKARYARVVSRLGRPELDTYRVACELAHEEMLREYELIDRFCRSEEYRRLLPNEL